MTNIKTKTNGQLPQNWVRKYPLEFQNTNGLLQITYTYKIHTVSESLRKEGKGSNGVNRPGTEDCREANRASPQSLAGQFEKSS